MAVDDLWRLKDDTPSRRDGRGKRYRVRVDQSPCANLTLPAEEAHEPIYLSTKQVAAIASNAHGWGRDRRLESRLDAYRSPMIWFIATTAVRIGELV